MTLHTAKHARKGLGKSRLAFLGVFLTSIVVFSGCTYVPDWANPVEWYDNVIDMSMLGSEPANNSPTVISQDENAFPSLSSVPDQVPEVSQLEERLDIVEGLVADRNNAEYTDDTLRAQDEASEYSAAATVNTELAYIEEQNIEVAAVAPPPPPPTAIPSTDSGNGIGSDELMEVSAPLPPTVIETLWGTSTSVTGGEATLIETSSMGSQITAEEVFNHLLMASAATVITSSEPIGFALSEAQPLTNLPNSVPAVVRETYNESLAQSSVSIKSILEDSQFMSGVIRGHSDAAPLVVKFSHGSASITARDRHAIQNIVKAFNDSGGTIRVVGHASSRTRNMTIEEHKLVNFWISVDRAQAVADELMRQGVSAKAIEVEARGDAQPVYFESMPAGEAENRRAEVYLEF